MTLHNNNSFFGNVPLFTIYNDVTEYKKLHYRNKRKCIVKVAVLVSLTHFARLHHDLFDMR